MEKNGLRYEGRMRHVKRVGGEWWDALLYAVIAEDFASEEASRERSAGRGAVEKTPSQQPTTLSPPTLSPVEGGKDP
jgi:hypothetical protein